MAQYSIDNFKSQLSKGGLRPTMYEMVLTIPTFSNDAIAVPPPLPLSITLLCKATQIPSSVLTTMTIGLPAGGALKIPSSRLFEPWTTKIINDDRMSIRTEIERWQNAIMGRRNQSSISPLLSNQFGTADITQLDRRGMPVKRYRLEGLYPENLAAQELNYEATDTISEFDCVWQFQYWEDATNEVDLLLRRDIVGALGVAVDRLL